MTKPIPACAIYSDEQLEQRSLWAWLQGFLAGTGITLATLYAVPLWNAWTAWAARDWLR